MHKVAILVDEQTALFELGCAVELFGLTRPEFEHWYSCQVVSFNVSPATTSLGLQLSSQTVTHLDNFDLLVVPSWPTDETPIPAPLAEAVIKFHAQGKRIVSFCSGAFLLAQLGLFNGLPATTHWRYATRFKQRFPEIQYQDDVLYLYNGQIGCSAGSSAAIDLGLEIIRNDFGYQHANSVARRLVLSAHRKGGQSQFAETPMPDTDSQFTLALDWALHNLGSPISIDMLAEKACMSRRTFDRKFRSNLNITPKEWLTHQRLNLARTLLEKSDDSIEIVAAQSGFENATTMRHHFRKELGIAPSLHREQFNA